MKDIERRFINPQQGALDTVLPDAVGYFVSGRDVFVANIDVGANVLNTVTVRTQTGQRVNGLLNVSLAPMSSALFMSDGSGWWTCPASPDSARLVGTSQALASGVLTAIAFFTASFDGSEMFNPSLPTRLTVKVPGRYLIGGTFEIAAGAGGNRYAYLRVNGTVFIALLSVPGLGAASPVELVLSTLFPMSVGDYVEMLALQDSGGPLNVVAQQSWSARLWAHRLS